ncbi:MAG: hypothetical protein JSU65_04070, partial [Candidatus Zixiibacteriota bacterium]
MNVRPAVTAVLTIAAACLTGGGSRASENSLQFPIDTTRVVDSLRTDDSLAVDSLDTAAHVDSLMFSDTLTEAQRLLLEFETKYAETHQRKEKETIARLSFLDTLVSYFVSSRLNMRDRINQSYALNAGDYFKFDPSWFALSHEATPMRTTVQPYGLAG